jgi:Heterokaryon incompatibility protein (HET)
LIFTQLGERSELNGDLSLNAPEIRQPSPSVGVPLQDCDEASRIGPSLYRDLQDSNEIRLLYLHSGSGEDLVKCTLEHAKFFEQPQYEALSYMWGSQNTLKTILVNDIKVDVGENMWLALQHLRLDAKIRVLWIDAICIDQRNIHERNHQVVQMGKIYNQAKRVVVWLGPSDTASKLAFEVLSFDWKEFVKPSNKPDDLIKGTLKLTNFYSILTREYWTRLWIIQEFLLAKDFVLQCGNDTCTGFRLAWFMEILRAAGTKSPNANLDEPSVGDRNAILETVNSSLPAQLCLLRSESSPENMPHKPNFGLKSDFKPRALFSLFLAYRASKCGDKRDNVFGLHSLALDCCKKANPIDYSMEWKTTLCNLVHHQTAAHLSLPTSIYLARPELVVALIRDFYRETELFSSELPIPSLDALERFIQTSSSWPQPFSPDWNYYFTPQSYECLVHGGQPYGRALYGCLLLGGYIRGRVSFTIPLLAKTFSHVDHTCPWLTPMIQLQIAYICGLRKEGEVRHPYSTTENDLIAKAKDLWSTSSVRYFHSLSQTVLSNESRMVYAGSNVYCASNAETELANNFMELFQAAQECVKPHTRHLLAFEENGLIFFASEDTRVGDLVCQFPGSDVLTVVEPRGHSMERNNGYELRRYSRGVNFLASPSNMAADICGKQMLFDRAAAYAITFEANAECVKLLCGLSDTPNNERNTLKISAE